MEFKTTCVTPLRSVLVSMVCGSLGFSALAQDQSSSTSGTFEAQEAGSSLVAEQNLKRFTISGSVDAYFRTNIDAPNESMNEMVSDFIAPSTSFADRNGFSVGMANIITSYEGEKVGFVADLVFGPRGQAAVDGFASSNVLNQAFVYYQANEDLKFTFGRFNTYLGYEVISPTGNFNYSTSYMFSNGPFSHNGLKVDYALDDNWSAMLAVMNPTDVTFGNFTDTYIIGAQIGYADDQGSAFLNFRYGNESGLPSLVGPTFQADLTTGWSVTEEFSLGMNATILSTESSNDETVDADGFYGVALYPQYQFSKAFALGLRGEYFARTSEAENFESPNIIATTLTGSYTIGDLTLKPELRFDTTDEKNSIDGTDNIFLDSDRETSGNLMSFLMGVVYAF